MPTVWRDSADAFANALRRHGLDPDAVTDVEGAWRAFVEFLQLDVAGIEPADHNGDGFILQCGRSSWNDDRLSLSMTRQLAVIGPGGRDDYDYQPELWQVDLQMIFDEAPELVGLEPASFDTGFRFEPIGSLRTTALTEIRAEAHRHALVRAMWATRPARSWLTFEHAC